MSLRPRSLPPSTAAVRGDDLGTMCSLQRVRLSGDFVVPACRLRRKGLAPGSCRYLPQPGRRASLVSPATAGGGKRTGRALRHARCTIWCWDWAHCRWMPWRRGWTCGLRGWTGGRLRLFTGDLGEEGAGAGVEPPATSARTSRLRLTAFPFVGERSRYTRANSQAQNPTSQLPTDYTA